MGRRESWAPYVERIEALCRKAGFSPRVVQEADTTESILAFVASGLGSTLHVERAFQYENCYASATAPLPLGSRFLY